MYVKEPLRKDAIIQLGREDIDVVGDEEYTHINMYKMIEDKKNSEYVCSMQLEKKELEEYLQGKDAIKAQEVVRSYIIEKERVECVETFGHRVVLGRYVDNI